MPLSEKDCLWKPSKERIQNSNAMGFIHYLKNKDSLELKDFRGLYEWSIENADLFWGKFLDFSGNQPNKANLVNNYDWISQFTFLDFIRDVGKHITVNYMMSKDSVKRRLEDGNGLSFTEFSYQLIQGYDFYHLWKNENCTKLFIESINN